MDEYTKIGRYLSLLFYEKDYEQGKNSFMFI